MRSGLTMCAALGGMFFIFVASAVAQPVPLSSPMGVASLASDAQSPAAPTEGQPLAVEVSFVPLPWSESDFAKLGPVGPFFPQRALASAKKGGAILECHVQATGFLTDCKVVSEAPKGFDFGVAASVLAKRKRIRIEGATADAAPVRVHVPFDWAVPAVVAP